MLVNIMQILPASHKVIPNFNLNKHTYKILLMFVTFTAMWNGRTNVLATDYYCYVIAIYCPVKAEKCKYVPFEFFKCITDLYIMSALPISYKMTIGFESLSVNPSVLSSSHPHRTASLRIKESSKYFIFQIV
jgi:hypothetical protein